MKKKNNNHSKETQPWRCAFSLRHFVLTGVALSLIVTGCILMLPEQDVRNTVGGRYAPAPGPGAFDPIRIRVAPIPCFIGFAMMVPVILIKSPSPALPRGGEGRDE